MANIFLYNSLSRKKEKFVPINPHNVSMYTCGPTVYSTPHIGNFRTYVTGDILYRLLMSSNYQTKYIMNITDVGHLTGDNLGDADSGDDRMQKAAEKEGRSAWDIAEEYTAEFLDHFDKLNLKRPANFTRATDHIDEQIDLVTKLEEKGFTYRIDDGIYFDTGAYEEKTGKKYGELSDLDQIREGARVEANEHKKNPRDFALWKFSDKRGERHMEWDSPWGVGFPGWHIECSAMSMKYLGISLDIHTGGEDLKQTHHPNEIAQSEAATGETFVRYWIHVRFLLVDGEKMSKSKGNVYDVGTVMEKGYDPLALRYLYLQSHYRDPLNFTWESLKASETALFNLRRLVAAAKSQDSRTALSEEKNEKIVQFRLRFNEAMSDDLNTPQALAVVWEAMKSNIPSEDKYDLALMFDEVLGLQLGTAEVRMPIVPDPDVDKLIKKREQLRIGGNYEEADKLRQQIEELGYDIKDSPEGTLVYNKT